MAKGWLVAVSADCYEMLVDGSEVAMGKRVRSLVGITSVLVLVGVIGIAVAVPSGDLCAASAPPTSFSEEILPLLKWRCAGCHQAGGEGFQKSGLDLTSYAGLMKGTKFGPMIVPRDPDSSNLMLLLDWKVPVQIRMPHGKKKLSTCDRDSIRTWIREGAKDN
jgi:hypothetical protein